VGCDAVIGLAQPDTTAVDLVNDGEFDVDVTLYISDNQETIEELLTETGTRLEYSVPAGETVRFSRDCDALQAIVIENAELRLVGEIGPETGSEVLRDGSDFFCGDTIVFTFTHSGAIVDFDVSTSFQ
jgi:hypothetical protein